MVILRETNGQQGGGDGSIDVRQVETSLDYESSYFTHRGVFD